MRRTRPKQNALIAPNPGENLRSGTTASDQPATAGTVGGGLRRRRCLVVGWSVLPGDGLWPRRGTPQRSLQHKAGVQGLHASLGPLWTLIHQTDSRQGERGAALCWMRCSITRATFQSTGITPMAAEISDQAFALCSLLGVQFAPRIPGLKHQRLYSFGKSSAGQRWSQ